MAFWSNLGMALTGGLSGLASKSGRNTLSSFFMGEPEKNYQQSTLGPEQQSLYQQLLAANMGRGAGGSFGMSGDYYRDLLGNNPEDFQRFAAPEMRQFNEQTIPGLAEQFAGMGSGGLSSSGFRNAAVGAGADLSERLGALRAGLRQQGAQGLQQMGQFGLNQFNENIHRPATQGFLSQLAPAVGNLATQYAGMKMGGGSSFGQSSPYGRGMNQPNFNLVSQARNIRG